MKLTIKQSRVDEIATLLMDTSNCAWKNHVSSMNDVQKGLLNSAAVLVAIPQFKGYPLWRVQVKESSVATPGSKLFAGDRSCSALYLTERFYNQNLSRNDSIFLAAHTILEAGLISGNYISGLDVLEWFDGNPRFLETPEIERLKNLSTELSDRISKSIRSRPETNRSLSTVTTAGSPFGS
jgi:hypothetical protein